MFDIPYLADWKQIRDYRQCQTDLNTLCENCSCIDWDYKVGDQVLIQVYSAKQKVGMTAILGLPHQFIQMGQLGFNAELNLKDLTLGESHIILLQVHD